MSASIFRYEVPVDDQPHTIALFSDPVAVRCRQPGLVEFWAIAHDTGLSIDRTFLIVHSNQPLPEGMRRHWGTVLPPGAAFAAWHLIEVAA